MTIKGRSLLCAAMLAPTILLSACSGSGDAAGQATQAAKGAASSAASGAASSAASAAAPSKGATSAAAGGQQTVPPQRDATMDVKIDTCAVKNGTAQVAATVTNSGTAAENYVIAVEILQGGKRVDGTALLAASVPAGKSQKVDQGGTKSDLKGSVTCAVKSVQTMGG